MAPAGSIFVYRGEGAGWRSVKSTKDSLCRLLPLLPPAVGAPHKVAMLSADELLDGAWARRAACLVMPGGADLPYCRHLNGRGNGIIRRFVEAGGSYLGLCAGAYYACAGVVFEPGSPLEVMGDRELAFFPGVARGAAFPGFDYQTEAGAVATAVDFRVHSLLMQQGDQVTLQQQQQQQAFQQKKQGQPRVAAAAPAGAQQAQQSVGVQLLASPPQPPLAPPPAAAADGSCWQAAVDYCNGGPFFTTRQGGCSAADVSQLPGVTVLATYRQAAATPPPQPGAAPAAQDGQQQRAARVAVVRCRVGRGVAVLCGTHPELGPEWLDPCGESNAREGPRATAPSLQAAGAAAARGPAGAARNGSGRAAAAVDQQRRQQQQLPGGRQVSLSSSSSSSMALVVCGDVQLAAHTQALQQQLVEAQPQRDLFLSSLLAEALASTRGSGV